MRRIPLALALVGAVAVTGCMGGGKSASSNDSGAQKGVTGSYYYVNLFTVPEGGTITSTDGKINCGAAAGATLCGVAGQTQYSWAETVTLNAAAVAPNVFIGWAGDCSGTGTCVLSAGADKTVVAVFGAAGSGHGNFLSAAVHGPAYWEWYNAPTTAALKCNTCHGPNLRGMSIAPSCSACHPAPPVPGAISGHTDANAEAWGDHETGWTAACQRCHTNNGLLDRIGFVGPDIIGTTPEYLGVPANKYTANIDQTQTTPPGGAGYANGPLVCATCHNATASALTTVVFPSAMSNSDTTTPTLGVVTLDNASALCAQCHQGRESTTSINVKIGGVASDILITAISWTGTTTYTGGTSFVNPHYLGAAATMLGSEAKGWAEYPTKIYTGRNTHGVTAGKCTSCHNPHTLTITNEDVTPDTCGRCHFNETTGLPVANFAELEESRQFGFEGDIDGDNVQESLKLEIEGLEAKLAEAMSVYSINVAGVGICYSSNYPYFMNDFNANGICDAGESTAFKAFTPRLLRAAFNLKWAHAEPGAWAHNPRYAIEILFDAITDLNAGIAADTTAPIGTPVAFTGKRSFNGHFGGAEDTAPYAAFIYTSGTGFTSKACYQCHGGVVSFDLYLGDMTGATLSLANKVTGMQCSTCHAPAGTDTDMKRIRSDVATVNFPPQKAAGKFVPVSTSGEFNSTSMMCATCHSGRENNISIDDKIALMPDPALWSASFTNPHYLGAAGVLFGTTTDMLGQYAGKDYNGLPVNWGSPHGSPHGANCTGCHQPKDSKHTFEVDLAYCNTCHVVAPYGDYRLAPLKANIEALTSQLYTVITTYSQAASNAVCYNGLKHPYWYKDIGAIPNDGICQADETTSATLNAAALKATFNYKWSKAEPGAYAHNYEYMAQALIDSIMDLDPAAVLPLDGKGATGTERIVRPVPPVTP